MSKKTPKLVECNVCKGIGESCIHCNGTGKITEEVRNAVFHPDFSAVTELAGLISTAFEIPTAKPSTPGSSRRAAFNTVTRTETALPAKLARQAFGVLAALESLGGKKVAVNALTEKCNNGNGFVVTTQPGKRIFEFYRKDLEKRNLIICE